MSISLDKGLEYSGATIKPFIIAVFSLMNPEHNGFEFKIVFITDKTFNSVLELDYCSMKVLNWA